VVLSSFGKAVVVPNPAKVGIIIAGPEDHIYECTNSDTTIKYSTYQIMFGLELLTDIPEDFLKRMESNDHPDNPKGLDKYFEEGDE